MKRAVLLTLALPVLAFASSLESSIEGVSLPNAHWVTPELETSPLRGSQPKKAAHFRELVEAGVSDVLIFKKLSRGDDLAQMKASFEAAGIAPERVRHLAFDWQDLPFEEGCRQVITALSLLKQVEDEGGTLFYHCSLGEDRTGLLSGLYQVIRHGKDARAAFEEDMCAHGYADGHPTKPAFVAGKVHAALTPLYVKLVHKIEKGELSWDELDVEQCGRAARVQVSADWRCPQAE